MTDTIITIMALGVLAGLAYLLYYYAKVTKDSEPANNTYKPILDRSEGGSATVIPEVEEDPSVREYSAVRLRLRDPATSGLRCERCNVKLEYLSDNVIVLSKGNGMFQPGGGPLFFHMFRCPECRELKFFEKDR